MKNPSHSWKYARRLSVWIVLFAFLSACIGSAPDSPFKLTVTTPRSYATLLIAQNGPLTVWHDARSLQLVEGTPPQTIRKNYPLGVQPKTWSLYNGRSDEAVLLWLDTVNARTRLYTALLSNTRDLLRGPTEVSALETRTYAAVALRSDDLLTLWMARLPGQPAAPLYLQVVDVLGRPREATRIADDAAYIAVTSDKRGRLHAAWLEPGLGGLYLIRYAQISDAGLDSAVISASVIVGAIKPEPGAVIERLQIGVIGPLVTVVWGTVAPQTERGTIRALLFRPQPNFQETAREIALLNDARWPSPLIATGNNVWLSATQFDPSGHASPSLVRIDTRGNIETRLLSAEGMIGATALSLGAQNTRGVAWVAVQKGEFATYFQIVRTP